MIQTRTRTLAAVALLALAATAAHTQQSSQNPGAAYLHPTDAAKPMVRWWWFGPAVVKPEILRELQQMKADGIGGAELAFVYPEVLDSPDLKNLPFLSPEMLSAVTYAKDEGRRLGLRIDVTLCSGWPYGGPATPLAEAVTRLRTVEIPVPAGATSVTEPKLAPGESIIASTLVTGTPTPPPVRRTPGGIPLTPPFIAPAPSWDALTAQPLTPAAIAPSQTLRVALFFIQSHTLQQVKRAAVGAEGYVLDPFSKAAVATHLRAVGEPLVKAFGTTPPYAIFSDSLEAYGADWTPLLPAEFRKRRGYDLIAHLPELVAGGTPAAANIRHDYGITLTELVNENYLTQINSWATAHGTKFRSQTYGEPAVSFSSQRLAALPEGEGPQWRAFSTLRWASSANHVFGNNVTSGETFTWLHSPVFRATPLDMKAEADVDFIMGENSLSFHGWPYSPPQASATGEPGWSLYAAAVFNDQNPWHPVMPAVTDYITRISSLLRQGQPANQVALLLPTDDAWAAFHPTQTTITGAMARLITPVLMSSILSAGYNVDFIDAEAINSVGLGTHQILVIPPTDRIPPATLAKIDAFILAGGHVICVGRKPSLTPDGKPLNVAYHGPFLQNGPVVVPSEADLGVALQKVVKPDFLIDYPASRPGEPFPQRATPAPGADQLGFIRRHTPTSDIYFVANTSNQPIATTVTFGTTHPGLGSSFDTDTGNAIPANSSSQPLQLAPYESRIFVFGPPGPRPPAMGATPAVTAIDLSGNWQVKFTGTSKTQAEATLTDWAADPATKNYSGEVVYSRDFNVPVGPRVSTFLEVEGGTPLPGAPNTRPETPVLGPNGVPNPLVTRTGPGMHAYFDPPIREAALVFINGKPAGALWHPPYRLDVSSLLKIGSNHIEIRVYNTALNAWSALPPHDYAPLIAKYGDRFQMQDLNQVKPLPSGILGTIHLTTQGPQ